MTAKSAPTIWVIFGFVGETDNNVSLHTAVVNSPSLKRNIMIVYLIRRRNDKISTALLFSTDIHRFYKARFQPECSVP
ncbi:MAG: hypothetical protein BWK80_42675 [Desulfobacteraceae bacterium IS3]|jgi:hypothetical protein|nr:MAG: hypothetical protein BWK80_42675 [Desulfobacteraceae bacterium IS3]HAO22872.1 hypothetical protein [Desulfobacteraceae bacterium]